MSEYDSFIRIFKRYKTIRWLMIIYLLAIVVLMLPRVPGSFKSLIQDYRAAFFGDKPSVQTHPADLADIHRKLSALEAELTSLKSGSRPNKVAAIEKDLGDLKKTIFGDPEKALTIQRLNIEFANLKEQIADLRSQNMWLFGITLTLALAVLTAFIGVIRSARTEKKGSEV